MFQFFKSLFIYFEVICTPCMGLKLTTLKLRSRSFLTEPARHTLKETIAIEIDT